MHAIATGVGEATPYFPKGQSTQASLIVAPVEDVDFPAAQTVHPVVPEPM